MKPSSVERNFRPTSSGWSLIALPPGAEESAKIVHGQRAGVVKLHERSAASTLPSRSAAPAKPLLTVAVYELPRLRGLDGVSVAVCVAASKLTSATTGLASPSSSVKDPALIVFGSIGSSNVAVTFVVTGTPVAPSSGPVEVTYGAAVLGGADVSKATS